MVVAASAGHGEAQERLGGDIHLLVVDVVHHLLLIVLRQALAPSARKPVATIPRRVEFSLGPGGSRSPAICSRTKLVVRQILIERLDHVIAIAPGIRIAMILVVAGGIGVPGDIEPVASPALAVTRRGQQTVDDFFEGLGRFVGEEVLHLLESVGGRPVRSKVARRSSVEFVGGRRGLQALLFELGENETIDRRLRPLRVFHFGKRGILDWLKRPEGFLFGGEFLLGGGGSLGWHDFVIVTGPGRAHVDPLGQIGDGLGLEFAHGRHLERIFIADDLQDAAFFGLVGIEQWAALAAGVEAGGGAEIETRAFQLGVVAALAVLSEDGADLFFEEIGLLGGLGVEQARQKQEREQAGVELYRQRRSPVTLTVTMSIIALPLRTGDKIRDRY